MPRQYKLARKMKKIALTAAAKEMGISQSYLAVIKYLAAMKPINTGRLLLGIYSPNDRKAQLKTMVCWKDDWRKFDLGNISTADSLMATGSENLELTLWENVLGYELVPNNVSDVSAIELVAAVIYRMTTLGFTSEEVAVEWQKMGKVC